MLLAFYILWQYSSLTPEWKNIVDTGDSKSFTIRSSTDWAASSNQSWITVSAPSGISGETLTVSVNDNSGDDRSGQVIVSVNGIDTVLNISQCAYLSEQYPKISTPQYSQDRANPTIIPWTGSSLTFAWENEPQADYYQLMIYRQASDNRISMVTESPLLKDGKGFYTFENLALEKGELYSVQFLRNCERWNATASSYYFTLSDEDAWIAIDGEPSALMDMLGDEGSERFTITASGYWVARSNNDWILLNDYSVDQDDLDAENATPDDYDLYSGASGEKMCVSVLANPNKESRTGTVTVSSSGATATITVYQYQKYTRAEISSPELSMTSTDTVELPYGSIVFRWNVGDGGTGRYALRLEYKDPEWGWEEIFDVDGLTSRSYTISANELVAGCDYRLWLGTELAEDDYSGKRYYFYLQYEDELAPGLTVDWSNAVIGGRVNVYGSATGGAGDYSIAYELLCDGEQVGITTWGADAFYHFPITKPGEYQVRLYAKDASGRQKNVLSEAYTVGSNSTVSYLNISQSAWAVDSAGDSTNIIVYSSGSWTATASENWITVSASGSQAGIAVAQNSSAIARSGQVLFESGNNTATLTITQQGMEATTEATLTLSQSVWNLLNPSAAMLNLSIETDGNWSASGQPEWIRLSQTSGSGKTVVGIYADYNNGGTRSAELAFTIDGSTKKLYVTQVGADIVAQVLSVEVSDTEPLTGEEVVFTIKTKNADELLYMVDGQLIDTINVIRDTVTYRWTYSLAKKEEREVYFVPRRDGIQGLIPEPILMNVVSYGDLASPIITEVNKVNVGDSAYIKWTAVPDADHYTVYLYSNGNAVFRKTDIKDLYLTIEPKDLPDVGTYTLLVMASAKGYNQSESADILQIAMPEETFELIEPKASYAFDVGNKIDIKISNPDGYMLQAQVKKDGKVVALLPESGPTADLNPVYPFIPVEGGVHEFSILAYNAAGNYQWNDGATLVSIDVEGPAFKDGSYIGTGTSGMFAENAASFKIVANTAVTKVVVNDGVQDYIAENPVLNTSGGWTHTFAGTMAEQAPGKHVYNVTAYDAYGHSVIRTFTLYAAERLTEYTQYPQASSVAIISAPDQTKAIATLYPSDSATVIGQCGDYWYVNFDGIKGFVQKNKLGAVRLTTWDGLTLNWKSLSSEGIISYVGDNASFNLNWDCNVSLPESAIFRVVLFGQTGTAMGTEKTVYTGNKTSATIGTKALPAESYQAIVQVTSADGAVIYKEVIASYNIALFKDYSEYMDYMIKQDDYYDVRLNSVMNWGNRLLEVHESIVTTEYDGKTIEETLPTKSIVSKAVMDTYGVFFNANKEALSTESLRVSYMTESILYSISNGETNYLFADEVQYVLEAIGVNGEHIKEIIDMISGKAFEWNADRIVDALSVDGDVKSICVWYDGAMTLLEQAQAIETLICRYNRYKNIADENLDTIGNALIDSGRYVLVKVARF